MALKIRNAKKEDIKELAKIYSQTYTKKYSGEKWTTKQAEKYLNHMLKKQPDLAFLAEIDGKIVGGYFASVVPWSDGNHLVNGDIFVHPDYQKSGAGLELGKALYSKAVKKYNCVKSESITFKNKKFPLSWHEKRGFKVSKDLIFIEGNTKDMLKRMKKMS
ncbi:MAG: GNAT family N-acetyltransferase [Nanoarchaeota archaeon]|nr:GNAT family N-acetyltransferase [Nanoarchaeota archaeon]MBU1444752.1 GNAT family N-acetyltransferase [Nanoarchaeota archaeon]MBU2406561.1 GNAT family N-acetyltransferase [Nanoarchaeota archaeon]MBU2420115.1 GNAT family N-acetyltransferase [Nanoarchaeota archaeon]MBU2474881.1 GNAT family N-acetyltransferase [Nanoarchaeota archaeon]